MAKKKEQGLTFDVADGLLEALGMEIRRLEGIEADAEAEIQEVRAKYADAITASKEAIKGLDGQLVGLMKGNRDDLFADRDKVSLAHGLLLYARGPHVQIPRDALGKIEEQGWIDGVRVAKSVARDVVNQWPDERLAVIGARRTMKETYSYELRD